MEHQSSNQEGVFQRATESIASSFNDQSYDLVHNQMNFEYNQQRDYNQRMEQQRSRQLIRTHSIQPPYWSNSFKVEMPILGIISTIFLLCYIISIFADCYSEISHIIVVGIFVFSLYFFDCYNNGVIGYINNKMTKQEFLQYVDELKQMNINIVYKVKAYHVERTSSINSTTKKRETEQRRVYTFHENFDLPITKIEDSTEDSATFLADDKLLRVHNIITYSYGNQESQKALEDLRKYAEIKASRMDNKYEAEEVVEHSSIKTNIVIYNPSQQGDSLLRLQTYAFYCFSGLSLLYRILLNKRVPFLKYCIHKKIYSTYSACLPLYDSVGSILHQQLQNQQSINQLLQNNIGGFNQNNNTQNRFQNQFGPRIQAENSFFSPQTANVGPYYDPQIESSIGPQVGPALVQQMRGPVNPASDSLIGPSFGSAQDPQIGPSIGPVYNTSI